MTAAASGKNSNRSVRQFLASKFFLGLLAFVLLLWSLGLSGYWYLTANSPLALLAGGDRPIAAATAFVPAYSPFTLSLLTKPEKLLRLQQAMALPEQRSQLLEETAQLKQNLLKSTGLDYDRDIAPWVGNEVTFAFTDSDVDLDEANGQQAGYLLAIEIAPQQQQQARDFLQLFWQRQSLVGNLPQSEQNSGVRILYSSPDSPSNQRAVTAGPLTSASALVGDQFILFANDVRVLQRSIRTSQTAANLAQNRAYRQAVAQLPEERIGLAYIDTALIGRKAAVTHSFAAVGLKVEQAGLGAEVRFADGGRSPFNSGRTTATANSRSPDEPTAALKFLPANSTLALASRDFNQLESVLSAMGLADSSLPGFLALGQDAATEPDISDGPLWGWADGDYALGQVKAGSDDWILAVLREAEGIGRLDAAARAKGYSAVPIAIGEDEAIAWTRFKALTQGRFSRRASAGSLETEILGLHLQQENYEIFASSLSAMESALLAPQNSLLSAQRFSQAMAALPQPNNGYLYADWPAVAPALARTFLVLKDLERAVQPLMRHIDTLAATRKGEAASVFVQLK